MNYNIAQTLPKQTNMIFGGHRGVIFLNKKYVAKFSLYDSDYDTKKEIEIYKLAKKRRIHKYFSKLYKIFIYENIVFYIYERADINPELKYRSIPNSRLGSASLFLTKKEQEKLSNFFNELNISKDIASYSNYGFKGGKIKYIDYGI